MMRLSAALPDLVRAMVRLPAMCPNPVRQNWIAPNPTPMMMHPERWEHKMVGLSEKHLDRTVIHRHRTQVRLNHIVIHRGHIPVHHRMIRQEGTPVCLDHRVIHLGHILVRHKMIHEGHTPVRVDHKVRDRSLHKEVHSDVPPETRLVADRRVRPGQWRAGLPAPHTVRARPGRCRCCQRG